MKNEEVKVKEIQIWPFGGTIILVLSYFMAGKVRLVAGYLSLSLSLYLFYLLSLFLSFHFLFLFS